jgi:hypothetical protein
MSFKRKNDDAVSLGSLIEEEVVQDKSNDSRFYYIVACVVCLFIGCFAGAGGAIVITGLSRVTLQFDPHEVFRGGEGSYSVNCTDCSVVLIDRNECFSSETNARVPLIDVVYNGEAIRTHVYSVANGAGAWVIEGRQAGPIQNGVSDYVLNGDEADMCRADPLFTIVFGESGGTISRR